MIRIRIKTSTTRKAGACLFVRCFNCVVENKQVFGRLQIRRLIIAVIGALFSIATCPCFFRRPSIFYHLSIGYISCKQWSKLHRSLPAPSDGDSPGAC